MASELQTFVSTLEADAIALKDRIVEVGSHLVQEIISDAEAALTELAPIALQGVLNAAVMAITGQEKFGEAVTHLIQTVEARGKTVALNTAHMAVQQAYLAAKEIATGAATTGSTD